MKMTRLIMIALALVPLTAAAAKDNYPTLERVDNVLTCMKMHGGQTLDNLYSCSCRIDYIASRISFDDFEDAQTWDSFKNMPGSNAGAIRDYKQGRELSNKYHKVIKEAEHHCFLRGVKHIVAPDAKKN